MVHRHNRIQYFFFSLILLLSVSCEKESNITINKVDNQVVILSNFTPNEPFLLELSQSQTFNSDTTTSTLESADIQICKGENCEVLASETSTGNDNINKLQFKSRNIQAEVGVEYSLKVNIDGMDAIVSAEATTPQAVSLSHVAIGTLTEIPLEGDPENETRYEAKVSFQFDDPIGVDNYYQINFYQEVISNGNLSGEPDDSTGVEDYYSIDSDIINLRNVTDRGILLSDNHFDGLTRDLLFRPIFKFNPTTEVPVKIKVELRSVSKDYYDFYSSVYKQVNQGSDPFSQPVEIISNIKNGHGIFAGYSKDVIKSEIDF